jgi:hypothetical protein
VPYDLHATPARTRRGKSPESHDAMGDDDAHGRADPTTAERGHVAAGCGHYATPRGGLVVAAGVRGRPLCTPGCRGRPGRPAPGRAAGRGRDTGNHRSHPETAAGSHRHPAGRDPCRRFAVPRRSAGPPARRCHRGFAAACRGGRGAAVRGGRARSDRARPVRAADSRRVVVRQLRHLGQGFPAAERRSRVRLARLAGLAGKRPGPSSGWAALPHSPTWPPRHSISIMPAGRPRPAYWLRDHNSTCCKPAAWDASSRSSSAPSLPR